MFVRISILVSTPVHLLYPKIAPMLKIQTTLHPSQRQVLAVSLSNQSVLIYVNFVLTLTILTLLVRIHMCTD